MITENLSTLKIHKLTQEQYERELAAGNIDENALYLTPNEETDLSNYATKSELPTKTSDLTNDSGFLTGYTETDPTVPSWAKTASKPTYTKSEVGLGNVDNVKQYSASNPPPYPVASVSGKTGAIELEIEDIDNLQTSLDSKADKSQGVFYIEGDSSSTTDTTNKVATWIGSHNEITEYFNGLTILYKVVTAGSTTTTLNVNNLGAVTVVRNATTGISTSCPVNGVLLLTYTVDSDGTAYWKTADYDANTKNTAGTSNKTETKLFLAGGASQSSSGVTTYSNKNVYIGTDNCLYSNGKKVAISDEVSAAASTAITTHNSDTSAHADIREQIDEKANLIEVATYITPEMYGAKGDGTTDDSEAIQAAIDAAGRGAVIYLGKKTYATTSTLVLTKNKLKFVCDGTIYYSGTEAAIKMESLTLANIDIYAIEAPNGTALLMDSTDGELGSNIVTINFIFNSVIGVHLRGNGANGAGGHNIFYNKLHLEGYINSTNTCIYIEPIDALINENIFWVGRIMGGATYGVRINSKDEDGGSAVNGNAARNIFHGGNFEGLSDTGYSIHMHNSNLNVFHDFRTQEAYGQYVIGFSGQCSGNDIGLSSIILSEIDTSALTSTGRHANILRSPRIVGSADSNLNGQNKIWLDMNGFSCETSYLMSTLQTETWIFELEDGTTVEKQVVAS